MRLRRRERVLEDGQCSRHPAVAGFFYPADQETLSTDVAGYLSCAKNDRLVPFAKGANRTARGVCLFWQNCRQSLCRLAR